MSSVTKPHRIRCSEIWGGNRGDELDVETSGIRASLFSRACDGGKGGDLYYFSVCGSDLLTRIAIVDVVGHGESVSETSGWLYDSLADKMNSAEGNLVLADLNKATVERGFDALSTAAVAAYYRGNSTFYYSYAGHHPLLRCAAGESQWKPLEAEPVDGVIGLPLGVDEDCEFHQQAKNIQIGDRVFLYTDGVTEAMGANGTLFSDERLVEILNQNSGRTLAEIRRTVLDALVAHAGQSLGHDDVTFMIIEIGHNDE